MSHHRRLLNLILLLLLIAPAGWPSATMTLAAAQPTALWPAWFSQPAGSTLLPEAQQKIEPALLRRLLQDKEPHVRFIVHMTPQADLGAAAASVDTLARRQGIVAALQATAQRTQADVQAFLAQEQAAGRAQEVRPFWIFNGLALTGTRDTAFALAARPDVSLLSLDNQHQLPASASPTGRPAASSAQLADVEWNIERVRAPLAWNALGLDGTGIVVANVDSGVDWLHPALQSRYRGYDPHGAAHQHNGNWFDAIGEGALYPVDGNGHGTHTMGTIVAGEGIGVAPGAQWIAVRAFNSFGVGYDSWLHAAYEWLLAPGGDPALAPQVVNNSWGNTNSSYEAFRYDVQTLRQAGIHMVFSAGNNGPEASTVNSPASYPEALAVGATDRDDEVAYFSGRGPSPWGEIKPQVSAPGVDVRSTLPGGSYGAKQGTSMAAPHVAGVLALLLQADPTLTVTNTGQILIDTALPLPTVDAAPNNDYGWGRVDAYAAALAVAARGVLSGTVSRSGDGAPIPQATLWATPTQGGATIQAAADAQGRYVVGLYPGQWDVTATAFGHTPQTVNRIELVTGTAVVQDFSLTALPTGQLSGTVRQAGSGVPLSATVLVDGAPTHTSTDPASGAFSLSLPTGAYTLSARSPGHRVDWSVDVPITAGQTTVRHFALVTAPTILLVDSGAWYYDSQIGYYQSALESLDYLYDTRTIKHLPDDLPTVDDLRPYDVVVWSAPADAPGYIGASTALSMYLEDGGRLLLSGQDVAYWDGGGSVFYFADYFPDYLHAAYVADEAATRNVLGRSGEWFDGLNLTIEGGDGAENQNSPDVARVLHPDHAAAALDYQNDGLAGLQIGLCEPYRAIYLAFGLEGIDNAADRQETIRRSLEWLTSPRQARGIEFTAQTHPVQITSPGHTVTHSLRLRNTGETAPTDQFDVTAQSARGWPYTLSASLFSLPSCQDALLTLTVHIPPGVAWDEADTLTLTARSRSDASVVATVVVTAKSPAPILLVDDDRWFDQQDRYVAALDTNGYRHDLWDVRLCSPTWSGPTSETLALYPLVLWYTAYDWYSPLTADEEARLRHYLDGGGRLFFSSQDYLYVSDLTSLGQDYFGLAGFTNDLTATLASGINGHPVGDRLGALPLTYPFRNWSDVLQPTQPLDAALIGQHRQPIGVAHTTESHKAIFFAFPFEALDESARDTVMERVVGWLSWLGESTFVASTDLAAEGQVVTYSLTVHNDGPDGITQVAVTNSLPLSLTFVPGSLTPAEASFFDNSIRWHGDMAPGASVTIRYRAALAPSLPPAETILNPAQIHLADHYLAFTRTARLRANAPDLGDSRYTVDRDTARPGETLTYTLVLYNDGLIDTPITWALTNPVPANTSYVIDSLRLQGNGTASEDDGLITWQGSLAVGQPVTLTYQTVITHHAGFDIVGLAWLSDGYGETWEKTVTTAVPFFKSHLPIVLKQHRSSFWPLQTTP
ncbi:MAG: S8 family serine peptidase [Chloroflexota bacterium]